MTRIEPLQRRVEEALRALVTLHDGGALPPVLQPLMTLAPPRGSLAEVTLRGDGEHWEAERGEVHIRYHDDLDATGEDLDHDAVGDMVTVLADAERNPHLHFVALKFLRDRLLPQAGYTWASSPHACQRAIADGIDRGILLTSKKPNPRNPAFPVTAVQLNRENEFVSDQLANRDAPAPAFDPIGMRGEPLSTTVIEERG